MKVSRVEEMQALDRTAIEKYGIPDSLLMENAGEACYRVLQQQVGVAGKRFAIICGTGNNGGDGLVVARKVCSGGGVARVLLMGDPDRFRGAAGLNYEIVSRLPIEVIQAKAPAVRAAIEVSDCIVDAIFGTGLTRDVQGFFSEVIELINASGKPVLSVDIPSGISGDTGQVMGCAVHADYTVTFGLPKIGNLLYPGYEYGGELSVCHISFPPELTTSESFLLETNEPLQLPPRQKDGHKGSFGDVLFIAGAAGYYGAPYFAALSFMKAGGGYSRLASPASVVPFLASGGSEIVFSPQRETDDGGIALENKAGLLDLAARVDMVVIGPGLSLDAETQQLVRELVRDIEKPLLIDGDGITALCEDLDILVQRNGATILTPHLGEMSRITGLTVGEIRADRVGVVQRKAAELGAILVLKGAHSLVGYPDGRVFINLSGNSGMATAGSGDVLTGTIAAMYGLRLSLEDAVRQGMFVHGFAGDLAAEAKGEDGITARDVLEYLPLAMKEVRAGLGEEHLHYFGPRLV
jgi:NAD(P)H-hydrate epimerase